MDLVSICAFLNLMSAFLNVPDAFLSANEESWEEEEKRQKALRSKGGGLSYSV